MASTDTNDVDEKGVSSTLSSILSSLKWLLWASSLLIILALMGYLVWIQFFGAQQ